MCRDNDKVCVWMSIDEQRRYNEWKNADDKKAIEPTEELINKVKRVFSEIQRECGHIEGLTELVCALETSYLKDRSFFDEECRKAGIIIEDLRRRLRDATEELDNR